MRPPRGLSREDAALWARVARTVNPIAGRTVQAAATPPNPPPPGPMPRKAARTVPPVSPVVPRPAPVRPLDRDGLDAGWERKLARGSLAPDYTLDLHGHGLAAAHDRLDIGLGQALALGARVVLVIAGRPRPAEAADRGSARGAIRAKLIDWLAAGPHAASIAAVRTAHRRHGGAGAVYVVLRRRR